MNRLHPTQKLESKERSLCTRRKATDFGYLEGREDGDLELPEGLPERSSFGHVQTHSGQSPLKGGAHPGNASRSPHATYRVLRILQPDIRTCGRDNE